MRYKILDHFKQIAEAIPHLVWTCLPNGDADYLSKQWEVYTGMDVDKQLGPKWLDAIIHPDDKERTFKAWMDTVNHQIPYEVQYRLRRYDGVYRWHLGRAVPIRNEKNDIYYWFGTCTDIDDQKRAALRLENFWNLPENLLAIANPDTGCFEEVSPAWEESLGYTLDEIKAQPWISFVHPDDVEKSIEEGTKLLHGESFIGFENRYRKKNGDYIWMSWSSSLIEGKFYCRVVDISERVMARQKLEKSERQYRIYAEVMPQMAFIADPEGNILFFNQRHYDYTGVVYNDIEGWKWKTQNIIHPDDLDRTVSVWTHALKTGEFYENEYRLRRYDGTYRWHLARAIPVRNEKGEITEWFGTNTDIHESKMATEELKIVMKELKEAIQARDEFMSIASHELKTPITSIKLKNQMYLRSLMKNDKKAMEKESIINLTRETDMKISRIVKLVDDMLSVSKMRLGRYELHKEKQSISTLVTGVIHEMEAQFLENNIVVPVVNIIRDSIGDIDKLRIEQIFQNILTNAIKYGGGRSIDVSIDQRDHFACIHFRDHGPGIPDDLKKKIFKRFERGVDSTEISGLGLGLFISQQIADAHGGKITVESTVGQGSTFTVELPISE